MVAAQQTYHQHEYVQQQQHQYHHTQQPHSSPRVVHHQYTIQQQSSPTTRQLLQRHPDALVITTNGQSHLVPCHVVYQHGQGQKKYQQQVQQQEATSSLVRRRRQTQANSASKGNNASSTGEKAKSRHRKHHGSKSTTQPTGHKSAPSSPVGTPRRAKKHFYEGVEESLLMPQWIDSREQSVPRNSKTDDNSSNSESTAASAAKLTGCCGKARLGVRRRPLSSSYSALDSVGSEEQDGDNKGMPKQQVSECVKHLVSWVSSVGDRVGKGTSALIDALPSLKEDHHVVMVGLDSAGKSTVLYRLKFDQYVNTVPTIGFNCERVRGTYGRSRGLTFLVWDVGGQEKVRPLWKPYTRATDAVVFVVDSTDIERLEEAKLELHRIMRTPDNVGVPLLVIANKQDLPSAKSPGELERSLGLSELGPGQLWHLEPSCAVTGEGLDTALDALHNLVVKRKKQKKRLRNKTR